VKLKVLPQKAFKQVERCILGAALLQNQKRPFMGAYTQGSAALNMGRTEICAVL